MSLCGRLAWLGSVAALVVACGGSSAEFLGVADDAGPDAGGGSLDASSDGAPTNDGSTREGGTKDAGGADGGQCGNGSTFSLPATATACATTDGCVVGFHEVTCCGAREAIGYNHAFQNQFDQAETTWETTCPKCACGVPNDVIAQDGKTGPSGQVLVKCDFGGPSSAGKCVTYF